MQVVALPAAAGPASAQAAVQGGAVLGHLPAPVARHLAPLLDSGRVLVEGVTPAAPGGVGGCDAVVIALALRPRAEWRRWRRDPRRSSSRDRGLDGDAAAADSRDGSARQGSGAGDESGVFPWDGDRDSLASVSPAVPADTGTGVGQSGQQASGGTLEQEAGSEGPNSSETEEPLPTQAVAAAVAGAVAAEDAARARGTGPVLVESFRNMAARVRCGRTVWCAEHYGCQRGVACFLVSERLAVHLTVATCILAHYRERDGHLFDDIEASLLSSLMSLPHASLSLVLRLLLRRRVWHPVASIAFDDVPDVAAAAEQLAAAGLAVLDDTVRLGTDLHSLLEGLPADTLKGALAQLAPARHPALASASAGTGTKAALVSAAMVRWARATG